MPVSQTSATSAVELLAMGLDEGGQVLGAHLLLALDQHGDADGQRAGDDLLGAAGLDEGHDLTLVVAGAAGDDELAAGPAGGDARLERRGLPQRSADRPAARRNGRRTARGGGCRRGACRSPPDVRRSRARSPRSRGPSGRPRSSRRRARHSAACSGSVEIEAIRRKREQALQAAVEFAVDGVEDSVQLRHQAAPVMSSDPIPNFADHVILRTSGGAPLANR